MTDEVTHTPAKDGEAPSRPGMKQRALRRAMAGTSDCDRVSCGPPSRLASGEWMQRIAFDLPEAMRDELVERAGGEDGARMGEVIRGALAAAGICDPSHVPGVCDGSHSDDAERAAVEEESREWFAQMRANLTAQAQTRRR